MRAQRTTGYVTCLQSIACSHRAGRRRSGGSSPGATVNRRLVRGRSSTVRAHPTAAESRLVLFDVLSISCMPPHPIVAELPHDARGGANPPRTSRLRLSARLSRHPSQQATTRPGGGTCPRSTGQHLACPIADVSALSETGHELMACRRGTSGLWVAGYRRRPASGFFVEQAAENRDRFVVSTRCATGWFIRRS
jgi:hypothetical protein